MKFLYTLLFCLLTSLGTAQVLQKRQCTLMGSVFEITLVDKDSLSAQKNIDLVIAEISRIENLISEWIPTTEISAVNRNAGIRAVKVSPEVYQLTERALKYSEISGGAFDISIIAMDKIWQFDGSMTELPSVAAIWQSIQKVGYKKIILNPVDQSIYLAESGMKIGFGSIGKAYAADQGRIFLKSLAVQGGIINASGDITTWGMQPQQKPWLIGIKNPFKRYKTIQVLKMKENAVVTSGSYEKYAEIDDKRYAHIIDPKTGYPASGLTSVSIYGPSAEFANALSTSMMVLGQVEGIKLAKRYPDYKYILLTDQGKVKKN